MRHCFVLRCLKDFIVCQFSITAVVGLAQRDLMVMLNVVCWGRDPGGIEFWTGRVERISERVARKVAPTCTAGMVVT